MLTRLAICILFSTSLNAAMSIYDVPTNYKIFGENDNDELAKISASCLTMSDLEELTGYRMKGLMASIHKNNFLSEADEMIGIEELRAALGFPPPGNWTNYKPDPKPEDFRAATNLEEYFNLREPRSKNRSLDSDWFYEYMFPPVIAFIDKRFPGVRKTFRLKFQKIRRSDRRLTVHRETVDRMIDAFHLIVVKVIKATNNMGFYGSFECKETRRKLNN